MTPMHEAATDNKAKPTQTSRQNLGKAQKTRKSLLRLYDRRKTHQAGRARRMQEPEVIMLTESEYGSKRRPSAQWRDL